MENWKLHLAGMRNALKETLNIRGNVSVDNLPEVQRVEITNPQEPTETVKVSNLIDYREDLNKIIGELIKVPKDIKTADYSPIIKALQEVVKTLEADKTDYSPIILSISSAVKELKDAYPTFNIEPIVNLISGLQQFNLDAYLKYGELPVIINEKQIEKLVKAFASSLVTVMQGGGSGGSLGSVSIDTTGLATSTIQTNGTQKTKVIDSAGTVQDWAKPEGQLASANSMGVVFSTEQEAIINAIKTSVETLDNAISGSEMQVDVVTMPTVTVNAHAVTNAGTFAVQDTSTAYTPYHLVSAASTNATVVKSSAGTLYGWYIYNSNAAARKLAFHNASSTPTAGASIYFTVVLPAGAAANVFAKDGVSFSTGISFTTVTELTDAGTTGVAASDLIINLFYK